MTPFLVLVLVVFITFPVVLFGVWVWTQGPWQSKRAHPGAKPLLQQTGDLSAQHVAE